MSLLFAGSTPASFVCAARAPMCWPVQHFVFEFGLFFEDSGRDPEIQDRKSTIRGGSPKALCVIPAWEAHKGPWVGRASYA